MSLTKTLGLSDDLAAIICTRKAGLGVAALLSVLASACGLAPYIAVYLVAVELFDRPDPDTGRIAAIAIGAVVALLARAVFSGLAAHISHVSAYSILATLRHTLMGKMRRMPLGAVQSRSTGEVKKILGDDVEQLEEALAHGIPDLAAAVAVPLATTILLLVVDWRVGLAALACLLTVVLISRVAVSKKIAENKKTVLDQIKIGSDIMSYLQGIKVIRGFLRPDAGYDQAREAVHRSWEIDDMPRHTATKWWVNIIAASTGIAIAVLTPFAGSLYSSGSLSFASLALFLIIGLAYTVPVMNLLLVFATLFYRIQFAGGQISVILAEPDLPQPAHPRSPEQFDLTFTKVGFSYSSDATSPTLENVTFTVPQGSSLALVGPTGAGKSTIANLIGRLWDINDGAIRIGGVDIREMDEASLRRVVAVVSQNECIFDTTLLENIRVARPDATDEQVIEAGRAARLDRFAERLDGGWDAHLGTGGISASGGERQRIAVARALLKGAPIVVLDEITGSLDPENEEQVIAAISELSRGRTVISIAHRLSTIVGAEQIAVVDDHTIADIGTHAELLAVSPVYQKLHKNFAAADGWTIAPSLRNLRDKPRGVLQTPVPVDISRDDVAALNTEHLEDKSFGRQWIQLLGRGWPLLRSRGVAWLSLEALVKSTPIAIVFLTVRRAIEQGPQGLTGTFLATMTAWLVGAVLVRLLVMERVNNLVWGVSAASKADIQLSLLERLRTVPMGFFARFDAGRLHTLIINDVRMLDFQNVPQQIAGAVIAPIYSAVILVIIDWRLALCAFVGVPIFLLCVAWGDRINRRVHAPLHVIRDETAAALVEQVRGAAEMRAYADSIPAQRYRRAVDDLRNASVRASVLTAPAIALSKIAVEIGAVFVIVVGSQLFISGSLSSTTLLLFLLISLTMYQPLQELTTLSAYRQNQQQIAHKIAQIWDSPTLPEPLTPATPVDASVCFNRVDFGYDGRRTLTDVSFRAEPGTITALVGPSGAGKSTAANLVARFWDVDSGQILLGGEDLRDIGTTGVQAQVATVYQDVFLFDDTIRANVSLGNRDATEAQIRAALDATQCSEFVEALDGGIDARIGGGGANLSGGQRQRLSMARALVADRPIVLLDEAVASVDPTTEAAILEAMSALMVGRTVIVIAHRLSTITSADNIVVFDEGRIEATGTHEAVLDKSATYQRLWQAHQRAMSTV